MRCSVCRSPLDGRGPVFANAWEELRKKYPCCSPACAAQFNPDEHWIPAHLPEAAAPAEEHRLVRIASRRLKDGDAPSVVTQELLLAGVAPLAIRKVLGDALAGTHAATGAQKDALLMGAASWLLTGVGRWLFINEKRSSKKIAQALRDLETWEAELAAR